MKQHYFIKFDPRIKRFTGCDRATLILEKIEYFFSKQPNGFYKFIEPCSHRLYKKFDSWSEELGCDRKCFTRSWEKIAFRHKSRRAFNEAIDKFEGKLYASFYDRNRNQMFFIRNHEVANETLKEFYKPKEAKIKKDDTQAKKTSNSLASEPLRNGHIGRSNMDVKMTPSELFKNNSHASNEIVKKMIEIWTAIIGEGRELIIDLKGNTIPFLKKAFTDKFDSCLQKWKEYCITIACNKFLMGEKTSFKATLDWSLKFESIRKVLNGYYGIGDRTPKAILSSQADLQEEILTFEEAREIKDFRTLCLQTVGNASYISYFKNLDIEFREEGEIALVAPHKFGADSLECNFYSYLRVILQGLGKNSKKISILAPGEAKGRLIELDRETKTPPNPPPVSTVEHSPPEKLSMEEIPPQDEPLPETSLETKRLREKLRNTIPPRQFPNWLSTIEVKSIDQEGAIVVTFEDEFMVNYCRGRFSQEILSCAKGLWQTINCLVIQEKSEDLKGFEPLSFQDMAQGTQNFSDCKSIKDDAECLLNMAEPKRENAVLKGESLPEVSLETKVLREKLRNTIPPRQFPSWLSTIEVEGIDQEGVIVVTFDDELIANYCRGRFSQEILQSATSLWRGVNRVVVRHKLDDDSYYSVEKLSKSSENIEEKSMFEQALQSLLSACSSIKQIEASRTGGACQPSF